MSKVSMVGSDLSLDSGVGTCGKDGQSVPVGVGQPTRLCDHRGWRGVVRAGASGGEDRRRGRGSTQAALSLVSSRMYLKFYGWWPALWLFAPVRAGPDGSGNAVTGGPRPGSPARISPAPRHRPRSGGHANVPGCGSVRCTLASGGIELIEQGQNGVSVLIAHQLADEHDVPFTRDIRGVLGRIRQGGAFRRSVAVCNQVRLERCKALAEVNQRMQLAFDLGFAFSPSRESS